MATKPITEELRRAIGAWIDDGHTGIELGDRLGLSEASVSRIRSGKQRRSDAEIVDHLHDMVEPYLVEHDRRREMVRAARDHGVRVLPVLTSVHCSEYEYTPSLVDQIDLASWDGETVTVKDDGRHYMAFRAHGDSMDGPPSYIQDGDIVLVDVDVPVIDSIGKPCAVVFDDEQGDEQFVCKRLARIDTSTVRLTSDGERGKGFDIPRERVKFIWRAAYKISPEVE